MIKFHYRVTKYDSSLRDAHDFYGREEWFGWYDIGAEIGGHVLTEDEYQAVENKYLYAAEAFIQEAGAERLTAYDVTGTEVAEGASLTIDQAIELVRLMLREEPVSARLEVADRFYLHVGDRMNMWIGSDRACPTAVSEAERIELFVDEGVVSPVWSETPADRHWWLEEGDPVRWQLAAFARDGGEPAGVHAIPADRVADLRRLFPAKRYDPGFLDRYPVGETLRGPVGQVLQLPLDPGLDYVVGSVSAAE
jgi:hypothetical protein